MHDTLLLMRGDRSVRRGASGGVGLRATAWVLPIVLLLAGCWGGSEAPGDGDAEPLPPDGWLRGPYSARAGVLLAPPAEAVDEHPTVRVLASHIAHTPPGATIRIVAYSLSLSQVSEPLIAAAQRGVRVQVVVDGGHSRDFKATQALQAALGEDRSARSFIVLTRRSARGTQGHQHQKSWSFSRTGDSRHVVLVGSMNLSQLSTTVQYTDMYAFVGRRDVYRAFSRVFRDQVRDRPLADPAVSVAVGGDRLHFFPGFDDRTDPVAALLARLPDAGTRIRIAMHAWVDARGLRLAELVADKVRRGAEVEVIAGVSVGPQVLRTLREAGVVVHDGEFTDGQHIHHKLMLVSYLDAEGRRRRLFSTGSDNFGTRSFERDDVAVVVAADRGPGERAYRDYRSFFYDIVARGASG